MYVGSDFDPIDVGDSTILCFDFAKELEDGDTLSSVTWIAALVATDEIVNIFSGDETHIGTKTYRRIEGMAANTQYRLTSTVVTAKGDTLSLWSHIYCTQPV